MFFAGEEWFVMPLGFPGMIEAWRFSPNDAYDNAMELQDQIQEVACTPGYRMMWKKGNHIAKYGCTTIIEYASDRTMVEYQLEVGPVDRFMLTGWVFT